MGRYILTSVRATLVVLFSAAIGNTQSAPAFDVVSIKPVATLAGVGRGPGTGLGVMKYGPGKVSGRNVTANRIVMEAYHLTQEQVSGGPDWFDSIGYDIEAKTEDSTSEERLREMWQSLLKDRFKLQAHDVAKKISVYELKVSSRGSKLAEIKDGGPLHVIKSSRRDGARMIGSVDERGTLQHFAEFLSKDRTLGRPVLDKTGLTGNYSFYMVRYADEDIAASLETQLGLKLESQKASLPVLVIDHIEKPSEN